MLKAEWLKTEPPYALAKCGKNGEGGLSHEAGVGQNFNALQQETERLGGNSWPDKTTPRGFGV